MPDFAILDANRVVQTFTPNPDPPTGSRQNETNDRLDDVILALAALVSAQPEDPATGARQDDVLDAIGKIGTRAYGAGVRVSVGAANTLSDAIAAEEVLVHAKGAACYVLAVSGSGNPVVTAQTGIPLEAGEKFHLRITPGQRIATIRDTADGFVQINPVL